MVFEQKTQKYVCHRIKAGICTYACGTENTHKHKEQSLIMLVMVCACSGRSLQGVPLDLEGFLMAHKGGPAHTRGGPTAFH